MSDDQQEYLRVLASLETNELALLHRQLANQDPSGLSRKELLDALNDMPPLEDFYRQVGEIKAVAAGLQAEAGGSKDSRAAKGDETLLEPDENVFSSQPGKWSVTMSVGPDRRDLANRIKWARLLYQEQRRNRERLLEEAGVFLCDWDDSKNDFVPIPDDDRSAADTATGSRLPCRFGAAGVGVRGVSANARRGGG